MWRRLSILLAFASAALGVGTLGDRLCERGTHHYAGFHPSHVVGANRITREVGVGSYDGVVVFSADSVYDEAANGPPFVLFNLGSEPTGVWDRPGSMLKRAGFMAEHWRTSRGSGFVALWSVGWDVAVPHWFLALLFSLWPAIVLGRHRQRRADRRRAAGLCAGCGYDLRGSPDRCPECGAARPTDAPVRE
jgi:hypothetical protein